MALGDPAIEAQLVPLRAAVKEQGDLVKKLKVRFVSLFLLSFTG